MSDHLIDRRIVLSRRGFYHSMFREFLDQDFMQPCVLTGAIDALLGPQGKLSAAWSHS